MPGFSTNSLKVATGDGQNFTLLESFSYTSRAGVVYTVPVGATSDGASTPRVLWRELPPFGRYWMAAFVHDYLYRLTKFPKDLCDILLKEMMQVLGCSDVEVDTIYEGVHIGGQSSFDADRAVQVA